MAPLVRPARHTATRYVLPLREGGSLPAVTDTAEGGLFVLKFRGAGQGPKALLAEAIVGLLGRALDLPVPEVAFVDLDQEFGRSEPDPEIQDILRGSRGLNVGLRYLDGAFNFDSVADLESVEPELAARIVWLDALCLNLDRTPRNPNLLVWKGRPWLIDHGAALYLHHDWESVDEASARQPFSLIAQHVLLERAADVRAVDDGSARCLTEDTVHELLELVPDDLLMAAPDGQDPEFSEPARARRAYAELLKARLRSPRLFAEEASRAREARLAAPRPEASQGYRR